MAPLDLLERLGRHVELGLRTLLAFPEALFRPRNTLVQLYHIFIGALPLALVGGVALGTVVWLHLRQPLQKVGGPSAVEVLPQALALAVVLELAPIAAGLIVAGRSGASLGAELSSMKLTEQIDALQMVGVSPLRELVAPRVLGCMLALPLLSVTITYSAIGSGFLAEGLTGGMNWAKYQNEALRLLYLRDVVPALLKTVVFGYLIGVISCYAGLDAQGGTEGVGRAATRGVVGSIFAVLVANVLLVMAIQWSQQWF